MCQYRYKPIGKPCHKMTFLGQGYRLLRVSYLNFSSTKKHNSNLSYFSNNASLSSLAQPISTTVKLLLLFFLFSIPLLSYAANKPTLIVNKSVQQSSISMGALRTIFGMRLRSWNDGTTIRVIVLPDNHPLHSSFSKRVLGMFPHQLRWAWDRLVYSGTGQAPIQVSTEEQMLHILQTTAGAIGYLETVPKDDNIHPLEIR